MCDIVPTCLPDISTHNERNEVATPCVIEPSIVNMDVEQHVDGCDVYGVSFLGRHHKECGKVCQDFLLFNDLGCGWHLYIVSDGAGSAKASHRGARTNCEVANHLLQSLVERLRWKDGCSLPSEVEWHQQFYEICRKIREFVTEKVETLDEDVQPRDFNATLMVLLVTPQGMLAGHIGDGRMGYLSKDGQWRSIITPHRGEEQNQTIFVMNPWDKIRLPAFKMSGVLVPETCVVEDIPQSVVVMTDGCENFAWNCMQPSQETGMYSDVNTPFAGFLNPLLVAVASAPKGEVKQTFINFVDNINEACRQEDDDRTFMLGIYYGKASTETECPDE